MQYYNDNLANPCLDSTYTFLNKVASEVSKMYKSAGVPLNRINLGGDEPPGRSRAGGPVRPRARATPAPPKSGEELKELFFTRWNDIAHKYAPHTAGWEDISDPTRAFRLKGFNPLPWQNVWGWGREDWAYRFANEGTPVILAHATNLYMDLAYNKGPDEPGYYWAAYVDEKSTFTYQPFNVYANATEDRWGNPITPNPSWTKLTPEGRENILGIEAQLWGENGKTPEIREYQAFPKLLGVAERPGTATPRRPARWRRPGTSSTTPRPEGVPAAVLLPAGGTARPRSLQHGRELPHPAARREDLRRDAVGERP